MDDAPRTSGARRCGRIGKVVAMWLLAFLLVPVLAGLIFVSVSSGYDLHSVVSGSMAPAINVGDLVFTGPVGGPLSSEIEPGAIVTYRVGQAVVTHRVVSVLGDFIRTKGDAVEDADVEAVLVSSVVGVYIMRMPKMGYVSEFLQTRVGWFLCVIVPSFLLLILMVHSLWQTARVRGEREGKRRT